MKKSHPIRRTLLATAATVSGIVLLLSLKPASDPAGSVQAGAAGVLLRHRAVWGRRPARRPSRAPP